MPMLPNASLAGSHLIPPPSRPPSKFSGLVNSVIGLLSLTVIFVFGVGWLPNASFFLANRHVVVGAGSPGGALAFQGFHDLWLRKWGEHQFLQPDSKQIMRSEANDYHMNAVAIEVTADQAQYTSAQVSYAPGDQGNLDSLPDVELEQAITDAQAANLTPILTLRVRITNDPLYTTSEYVGSLWYSFPGEKIYSAGVQVGLVEHQWFDSYTAFAVHYAQLSQKHHLPYFIFGNDLVNMTTDSNASGQGSFGASGAAGDEPCNAGRRACGWRHVIHAIKSASYTDYQGKQQTGGGYTGKLIYGASWEKVDQAPVEFEHIAWWDAVDFIGISGYFPLTQNVADVPVQALMDAWHGKKDELGLAGQGDIIGRLNALVQKYQHPLLFTEAGYESLAGSNSAPGATTIPCDSRCRDDVEQEHDMEALLRVFSTPETPWFAGVLWSFDAPKWPRSSLDGWATSTAWAGDTVTGNGPSDAKAGGKFLASFYQPRPIFW